MLTGCVTTTDPARRRRAATWFAVAVGFALPWAVLHVDPPRLADLASGDRAVIAASFDTQPPADSLEINRPERDRAGLPVEPLSDDPLDAPRLAQIVDYGPAPVSSFVRVDSHVDFPRAFHPRAPPHAA